jgi:hypothetical protein
MWAWLGPTIAAFFVGTLVGRTLERRFRAQDRRRAQIATWRKMLKEVGELGVGRIDVGELAQKHVDYLSLEPHLTEEGKLIMRTPCRKLTPHSALGTQLDALALEINRIEREWGLAGRS